VANDVFLRVRIYGSADKVFSVITIGGSDVQKIVNPEFLQSIKGVTALIEGTPIGIYSGCNVWYTSQEKMYDPI
jgi:hypothetical protein